MNYKLVVYAVASQLLWISTCPSAGQNTARNAPPHKQSALAQKTPTTAEILDWLKDKVNSSSKIERASTKPEVRNGRWVRFVRCSAHEIKRVTGCRLEVIDTQCNYYVGLGERQYVYYTKYAIDLSQLRSDVEVHEVFAEGDFDQSTWGGVVAHFREPDTVIMGKHTYSAPDGQEGEEPQVPIRDYLIDLVNKDLADKVGKALRDAILRCGGKPVKELY
jgi:hypothetical protein